MSRSFEYILPPEVTRASLLSDPNETRVNDLIQPWDGTGRRDVAILSIPFARAAQRGGRGY